LNLPVTWNWLDALFFQVFKKEANGQLRVTENT
jgi:hypothetical protein